MNYLDIKHKLQEACFNLVLLRLDSIQKTIKEIDKSLTEESKNTSGDKHHTGRAMLHIEREKAGNQLREIEKVMRQLDKINIEYPSKVARLGSIIKTNQATFFLSISVGRLEVNEIIYLGVAPNSPIGVHLLGKEEGDQFIFNGKTYKVIRLI